MTNYILLWPGQCEPAQNCETISVPEDRVVYMTRAPQIHEVDVIVTNCTQGVMYQMPAGGDGNSTIIEVADQDVLCFSGRSSATANSIIIDVIRPR